MGRLWDLSSNADRIALCDDTERVLTYSDLDKAGKTVSTAVGSRCLVICLCNNSIGSIVGYVGLINNGIVPLLLPANLKSDLLYRLIDIYRPKFLWVPNYLNNSFDGMEISYEAYDYVLLRADKNACPTLYEELCLLLTTSGSTGSPKLVRQSYKNVLSNAQSIADYLDLDESERPITTLPMNYTYGLSIINSHLLVGATIFVTDLSLIQREFWSFFNNSRATSFGGVPYTFEILNRLRFCEKDLPSLRTITQAGGRISPELHEQFARYAHEKGKRFIVMYGQCEATARMGWLPPDAALEKIGAMGIAIPGGNFRLLADDDSIIDRPWTTGELVYEGPNVTLGYATCQDDLALGDENHGVLRTGDMAQFDGDGYYYIVGRKKRFLKIYGNRINLDEVDSLIASRFGIECASTGTDDHVWIFVTSVSKTDAVHEYISNTTGLNPSAFSVRYVNVLPKNEAGKILYRELTTYVENRQRNEF